MAYKGYVVELKNVRPHPNADRMKLADCFGNTVCVGLDAENGQVKLYFPTDGQLSAEFCEYNNLVRKKDDAGNNIGGYLDPEKRNIKAIKLRGEKSDGIVMGLEALAYTGVNISTFKPGDTIDVVNGHEICKKYIPHSKHRSSTDVGGNKTRKKKVDVAPLFMEHADTEQLAYNLGVFKLGDEIEITLKMHGTSQRTAHMPVLNPNKTEYDKMWKYYVDTLIPIKSWKTKFKEKFGKPVYDWGYVSGTRRTILEDYEGGYYGSNEFREQHSKTFEGKLWKGETVYYEVVGFTNTGTPIMADASNKKVNDKEFVKQYGETTTFSYGCTPTKEYKPLTDGAGYEVYAELISKQSDIYVYRMTMTNEDGDVVEYTPDFMRYRCEQMGVKCVPVMWKGTIPENLQTEDFIFDENEEFTGWVIAENAGEWVKNKAEQYYDGPDPIGKTHIREGVVVRILNRPKFAAYKHKNFYFKVLEGIIKDTAEVPDMEEAQEIENV